MSALLIKNAEAIVTVDEEDRILRNSNILMEDGVITYLGKESKEADEVIPAAFSEQWGMQNPRSL